MNNQKTNWKYILIVLILTILVGGGILGYTRNIFKEIISLTKFLEIKKPEKIAEDETVNWKAFRNEEYGYELKYPADWKLSPADWCIEPRCARFVSKVLPEGCGTDCYYDSFDIQVEDRDGTTYQDWVSGKAEGRKDFPYTVNKIKNTVVGGMETEIFEDGMTMGVGNVRVLFLVKDDFVYKITGGLMSDLFNQEKFDQMLSTFRFLE